MAVAGRPNDQGRAVKEENLKVKRNWTMDLEQLEHTSSAGAVIHCATNNIVNIRTAKRTESWGAALG